MKTVLIIGYGVSGKASAAFLQKQGYEIIAADRKAGLSDGIPIYPDSGDVPLENLAFAVLSPGVAPTHPLVEKILAAGIELIGETELAMRQITNRCIGVTGTNGKTTTVLLCEHVLLEAGYKAKAVGNIGLALTEYLLHPDPEEILVIELSSFQLESLFAKKLDAAVYLNLTPDHLDRYDSLRSYAAAKARIADCLKENGLLFLSKRLIQEYPDLFPLNSQIFDAEEDLAPICSEEYIQCGKPERQNVMAANALCSTFGVTPEQFERALETFRKPEHRIEWIGEKRGVHYYNDSKGTNVDAVMHAVALFQRPIVLIAGGVDKGASYAPWISAFQGKVKAIAVYGEAGPKIEQELTAYFPLQRVHEMADAFQIAGTWAKEGDVILLSPGCSSFDQFRNYEHRGEEYKKMVMQL